MATPAWLANLKTKEQLDADEEARRKAAADAEEDDDDFFGGTFEVGHSDAALTDHLAQTTTGKALLTLADDDDDDVFKNARRRKRGDRLIEDTAHGDQLQVAELADAQRAAGLKDRRDAVRDGDRVAAYSTSTAGGEVATGRAVYTSDGGFVESTENGVTVKSHISNMIGADDEVVNVVAGVVDGEEGGAEPARQSDYVDANDAHVSGTAAGSTRGKKGMKRGLKAMAAAVAANKAKSAKVTEEARRRRAELLAAAQPTAPTPMAHTDGSSASGLPVDLSEYQGCQTVVDTADGVDLDGLVKMEVELPAKRYP